MTSSACGAHPQRPAAARCAACSARMCSACFRFLVSERPSCAKCAFIERTSGPRRTSLALSFVLIASGVAFTLVHAELIDLAIAFVTDGIVVVLAVAGWMIARRPEREVRELEEEEQAPDLSAPMAGGAHPYRALARRAALAAAPKVSGTTVVLVVLASLAFSGVIAPAALRLPLWIELEIGIAISFVALGAVLTALLYRGYRLRDDFVFVAPWERFGRGGGSTKSSSSLDGCSGADAEGVAVMVLLLVALLGAFVLVELVVPLAFLLAYAVVMKALKTVAHDRHGCEGRLARSIGWGAGWSLVFVLPVALVVAAVHFVRSA